MQLSATYSNTTAPRQILLRSNCIDRASKKLVAAYFYYAGVVSWKSVEEKLGKNYKKQKMPNGRPLYIYQLQGRTVTVFVDSGNNVFNIGVW